MGFDGWFITIILIGMMWFVIYGEKPVNNSDVNVRSISDEEPKTPVISNEEFSQVSKIYISKEVTDALNGRWSPNVNEFRFCMFAEKYRDSYIINKIYEPETANADKYVVSSYDCSSNSVGFIQGHTLGGGICQLSSPNNMEDSPYKGMGSDVEVFARQSFPLTAIICGHDRYVFFTKQDTLHSLSVFVIDNDVSKEVTATNPCPGNRFCLGKCWGPCDSSRNTWICRSDGAICI